MRESKQFIGFMDRIKTSDNESLIESVKQGYSAIFTEAITVKVTFGDGNHLTTRINTDLEGDKKYYLGNMFNDSIEGDDMKKVVKVVKVEQV